MSTVFDNSLGQSQGRVADAEAARDGAYVFELGTAGCCGEQVDVGDESSISQSVSFAASDLAVRARVVVVEPSTTASGLAWEVVGKVGADERYVRRLNAYGRRLVLDDILLDLRGETSPQTVEFLLRAVAS